MQQHWTSSHSIKLGWALSGPGPLLPSQFSAARVLLPPTVTHIQIVGSKLFNDLDLNEILCSFWEVELLGIISIEGEKSIKQNFKEGVIYRDIRYEVSLP